MTKFLSFLLVATMLFSLSGCGNPEPSQSSSKPSTATPSATHAPSVSEPEKTSEGEGDVSNNNSKMLVVYFSLPETTDPNNMTKAEEDSTVVINGEVLGNTQYVAYLIKQNTGADIFRIEPKTPYPADHKTLTDLAKDEQKNNTRPEIAASVKNIEQYDDIFLGYPIWWADMPMILYTFLEEYNLSGKTIIPFNTHGGSGFSNTIKTIAELQPNATVEQNGFTVSRNSVADCENDVIAWLESLKLAN